MKKTLILASATVALLAAGAAQASNVHWSIGINLPPIGTVISNAPVYAPAPVYMPAPVYAPAPVIVAPPPGVYRPVPRVVYQQPVTVGRPVPIVYPGYGHGHGHWDRDRDGIPNRYDRVDNRRDWGDRDRDGIPNHRDRYDNRKGRH